MDSAAFAHVCPEKFAVWVPMQKVDKNKCSTALLANGEKVAVLGSRNGLLALGTHLNRPLKVELQFLVLKIRRPIVSIGMLVASTILSRMLRMCILACIVCRSGFRPTSST
jgi:hypothetical protein